MSLKQIININKKNVEHLKNLEIQVLSVTKMTKEEFYYKAHSIVQSSFMSYLDLRIEDFLEEFQNGN